MSRSPSAQHLLSRSPAEEGSLPPGWRTVRDAGLLLDLPLPEDFVADGKDKDGGHFYTGPYDQIVLSVYHASGSYGTAETYTEDQLDYYLEGAEGSMSDARSEGVKGTTAFGVPARRFEVCYHKTDSSDPKSRHCRLELSAVASDTEEVYLRVVFPDTPDHGPRAREIFETVLNGIHLWDKRPPTTPAS
ncbi:hypothetical protein HW445_18305 [Streptomyces sp. UH6]|nr:hypothetical protein [Streptomyces sp. UH6]